MIAVLTYMMLGALLMAFTFDIRKFMELLPTWYANYVVHSLSKGEEHECRANFDKIAYVILFLVYTLGWPAVLFHIISKLVMDKK